MRYAFFGVPHTGGTHTVYYALRTGLAAHGIEVKWLGVGPRAQEALADPTWAHEHHHGEVVAGDITDEQQQGATLVRFLETSGAFDGVFVNVLASRVQTNAMRYLSPEIRRVMIVHSITPGTYAAARAIRNQVHATVGVSPRIRDDLVHQHGFDPVRTQAIPNALDLSQFEQPREPRGSGEPLRLLFLGRLKDIDKGVFWLPEILARLPEHAVRLSVAGDGPDRTALEDRCAGLGERIRFLGRVPPEQVPALAASHDVFLFPSRFEGLPLTLVEAMAAGCVPVATRIKGVTDFVVRDGHTGLLFPIGDVEAAAASIRTLVDDPSRLAAMSLAARQSIEGRFDRAQMASAYAGVLQAVQDDPPALKPPLPLSRWAYPRGLRSGMRTLLPTGVKNWLRVWRERLA
ncbi:glycosyltransferase family 4 protein [Lamprobacter modestohalophilus]|uniref:glycosyltransferase family 4 protein n=1 Tax=Lamprobacter modestohalophilus TaxID=1064514 RepID=UPI002ADED7A4|nr:glycosyltransferase family 4 protein [Lamprobacter modestohalophilus]MEA1049009.1 glycosyltransferase family 4 protein [Lamprobacter modestohalophilus]